MNKPITHSLRLILVLTALLLPAASFANDFFVDGIYYTIESSTEVSVAYESIDSNPLRYKGDIVIPEKVSFNGTVYTVTSIGSSAFYYCRSLSTITCMALLPPSIHNDSFDEATYSKASLNVPDEAVSAYKEHAVWQLFYTPQSGITEVAVDADGPFDIYNIHGMLVKRDAVAEDIKGLVPDVYIVRQGAVTRKVCCEIRPRYR